MRGQCYAQAVVNIRPFRMGIVALDHLDGVLHECYRGGEVFKFPRRADSVLVALPSVVLGEPEGQFVSFDWFHAVLVAVQAECARCFGF